MSETKCKELHLYLDNRSTLPVQIEYTYIGTKWEVEHLPYVHTTQTAFLNFEYAERLFVHVNNEVHEITIGKCIGTDKEVHETHNIEKMLLNNAFDWFNNN